MNYTKRIFLLPVLVLFIYFFKGCNQESIELLTTENLELNKKIDSLLTITDNLNRQINSVENQIQDVYSSQSQTQDGINELTDELQDLLDSTNSNDQSIDNLTQSLNDLLGQNQNLSSQLDSLNTQVDSIDDTIIGNSEFADLTQLVESLQNQINQLSTQLSDLSDDVDDLIGHTHDSNDTSNDNSNDTNDNTLKFREKYNGYQYGSADDGDSFVIEFSENKAFKIYVYGFDITDPNIDLNNPPFFYCVIADVGTHEFPNDDYTMIYEVAYESEDSLQIKEYFDDRSDGFSTDVYVGIDTDELTIWSFRINDADSLLISKDYDYWLNENEHYQPGGDQYFEGFFKSITKPDLNYDCDINEPTF